MASWITSSKSCWNTFKEEKCTTKTELFINYMVTIVER